MAFSLASSALLVSLRLTQPKRKKKLEVASNLVREHFGCSRQSGDFDARLYPAEFERPQLRVYEEAFALHKRLTCRWEHGLDIITKKGKPRLDDEHRKYISLFDDAVQKQGARYDTEILPAARRELGQVLFDKVQYPTAEEWVDQWTLRSVTRPVPNTGDLRLTLPNDQIADIENELREQHRAGLKDVFGRLETLVRASATALTQYGVKPRAKLYQQTVQDHLSELVSAVDGLNIPNEEGKRDAGLEEIATEITNVILTPEFEDLKEDEELRQSVGKKASALADKLRGYA